MTPTFTIPVAALADALAVINTAVEKKGTIPALGFLLLEGGGGKIALTGTDLDTTVRLTIEGKGEGAFCVPMMELQKYAKLAEGQITVAQNGGRVTISSVQFESKLPLMEKSGFPECPVVRSIGIEINGPTLANALRMVILAAAKDDLHTCGAMQSVHVALKDNKLTLASTDGIQLAVATIPVDCVDEAEWIVPRWSVSAMMAFAEINDTVQVAATENHFGLIGPSGSVASRLLTGKFPQWSLFIPAEFPYTIIMPIDTLRLALRRAVIGLDSREVTTRWVAERERLTISSRSHEREGSGEMAVNCPSLNGEPVALGMNGLLVLTLLAAFPGEDATFSFVDPRRPFRFTATTEGFDYFYLIMGMKPDMY